MTRYVVVHHAHHPDEGVYRLIFARAEDRVERVAVENPEHDPDDPESQAHVVEDRVATTFHDPQDIVFADDERWHGRSPEDVAAEQRQVVKEAIDRQAAVAERAEAEQAEREVLHFEVGHEL